MPATVSIITITLGRESLAEACQSVDAQTQSDWHHYVIGDGVAPIDYRHPRRSTLGFTRALGASEPSADMPLGTPNPLLRWALKHLDLGRFVCFLDDDNCYEPQFLSMMVDALLKSDAGIALCGLTVNSIRDPEFEGRSWYRVDDDPLPPPFDAYPEEGRCDNSAFLAHSWMAREIGFPAVTPKDEAIQDYLFISRLAQRYGWVRVPEKLVRYGVGPNFPPQRARSVTISE